MRNVRKLKKRRNNNSDQCSVDGCVHFHLDNSDKCYWCKNGIDEMAEVKKLLGTVEVRMRETRKQKRTAARRA